MWFLDTATIQVLGELARAQGDYASAAGYYEESLGLARPHGSKELIALALSALVHISLGQGDYERAAIRFAECTSVCRELRDETSQAWALSGMAWVIGRQGQPEHAARLFGAAEVALERTGYVWWPTERPGIEPEVQFTRRALGDEAFEAAYAEGRMLSLEQAVESALMHARMVQG